MTRMNKVYKNGYRKAQIPSPPDVPEYLTNFGLAAASSLNVWTARNPTLWVQAVSQAVHGLRLVYYGYRAFKPSLGTVDWYDKAVPVGSLAAGIAAIVNGNGTATTDKAQAELWCWNLPQIYRPVTLFPLPTPVIVLVVALDVGLCATAAGLHWDQ